MYKNKLKDKYEQFLEHRMKSEENISTLRTYKVIKNNFEKFLELNERNVRKALSTFRISAHK